MQEYNTLAYLLTCKYETCYTDNDETLLVEQTVLVTFQRG